MVLIENKEIYVYFLKKKKDRCHSQLVNNVIIIIMKITKKKEYKHERNKFKKNRNNMILPNCIKIIVFTVFIITITFSSCITILYFQKSQQFSIMNQRYINTRFNLDRMKEIEEERAVKMYNQNNVTYNNNNKQNVPSSRQQIKNKKNNDDDEEKIPDVLILTILKDSESFGHRRKIDSYIKMIQRLSHKYDPKLISIGMLVSDKSTYEDIEKAWKKPNIANYFNKIKIFHKRLDDESILGGHNDRLRHAAGIQKKRRSILARYRNLLLSMTLGNIGSTVKYVLWIDADMEMIPANIITTFQKTNKKIVTLHTKRNHETYDLNTWKGPRIHPSMGELEGIKKGRLFIPRPSNGLKHIDQFTKNDIGSDNLVQLDSVGGTVLWVNADVHRQGINFPPYYVIGTEWDRPGWDGIETEGICYIADQVYGGKNCYGFPNIIAEHHAS